MTDIKRALHLGVSQLEPYSESARLDTEILLSHAINKPRSYLYAHPETPLDTEQLVLFERYVARRSLGMPIAYITGTREFWSLPLIVNEETLIPRPETERLVDITLMLLNNNPYARVLDLGTGSGAIALALAKEQPSWQILACDYNPNALTVAEKNAHNLKLSNIRFLQSDWFDNIPLDQPFDAIVSNPPYIAANDPHLHSGDVRFEPVLALVSGPQGLTAAEHIIQESLKHLKPGGFLLMEHGFDQKDSLLTMLTDRGYVDVTAWKDFQGNDRVCAGRKIII